MKKILTALAMFLGLLGSQALAQSINLSTLTLANGATFSNNVITFGSFGATATTTTLASLLTVGQNYTINITGTDGPGNRMFSATYPNQVGQTLDFGSNGLTLPFFVFTAETNGQLTLTLNGNGSLLGPNTISAITVVAAASPVPGPIAGAGLVPLLGLGGAWLVRRRKRKLAA